MTPLPSPPSFAPSPAPGNRCAAPPGRLAFGFDWLVGLPRRALLAAAMVIALASAPAFLRPFINDDASYAIVAQKLNTGHVLYRDAVDNKPPLIYFTFAAILRAAGRSNLAAVKLVFVAVNIGCAALLLSLGGRFFGARVGALAALLFACATVSGVARDSIAPNTEGFMNLFVLLALWFAVRHLTSGSLGELLAAGFCTAIATLYRLQGVGVSAALMWLSLRSLPGGAPPRWSRRLAAVGALGLGCLLPIVAAVAYLAQRDALHELWLWVFQANVRYIRTGDDDGLTPAKVGRILGTVVSQLPLLAATIAGVFAWWRRRADPNVTGSDLDQVTGLRHRVADLSMERTGLRLAGIQIAIGVFAYQMGKRFYGHYFAQVLPFAALLGAWALLGPVTLRTWRAWRVVPLLSALWAAAFLVHNARALRGTDEDPGLATAAEHVQRQTVDGDQVLLWGGSPLLTLWSGRDFATRFPFHNALTGRLFGTAHALPQATPAGNRHLEDPVAWALFWRDLNGSPPAVIADGRVPNFGIEAYPELAAYVERLYSGPFQDGATHLYFRRAP